MLLALEGFGMRMTRKDSLKAGLGAAGAYAGLFELGACGGRQRLGRRDELRWGHRDAD
jgi:hypothetical protein